MPEGGFLQGCLAEHAGEGIDVDYVRRILEQLATELKIDRARVYATGLSAGGGMAFELALEAPDLVAAIAPVAASRFNRPAPGSTPAIRSPATSESRSRCSPPPMIRSSRTRRAARPSIPPRATPAWKQTRDAWLAALRIQGRRDRQVPRRRPGRLLPPHTGLTSSTIERQRYPLGPDGQELWYYKAEGMGHWWPNPVQSWSGLWERFGKTNQDIDFADHAWEFFRRHARRPPS